MTTINGAKVFPNQKCLTCVHYDKYNHLSFALKICGECIHYALREDNYKALDSDIKYSGNPDNNLRKEVDIFYSPME